MKKIRKRLRPLRKCFWEINLLTTGYSWQKGKKVLYADLDYAYASENSKFYYNKVSAYKNWRNIPTGSQITRHYRQRGIYKRKIWERVK